MARERLVTRESLSQEEERFNWSLRPTLLSEYIGQRPLVEKLSISIEAAKQRGEPLEHVLFYGPPGLGKTTLAHIIARELGKNLVSTSGPALERTGDMMGLLTNLEWGDVLFIDEIHRLSAVIEEFLYPAMEDFKVDFVIDKGAFAKTIPVQLKGFTLVGATTRAGLISSPLRERFGIFHHLGFYEAKDLMEIVRRSAGLLEIQIEATAVEELARRARGTPRIANRLLRRVRDFVQVKRDGIITMGAARDALDLEGIDQEGLDPLDRQLLKVIIETYNGGPVGIEALAATLSEEVDTLVDTVEPFLLKAGFLSRTRSGRRATLRAYQHLGYPLNHERGMDGNQGDLW